MWQGSIPELKLRDETDEEEERPPCEAEEKSQLHGKGKSPLAKLKEEIGEQLAATPGSSSAPVVTPSYRRVASPVDSGSEVSGEGGDIVGVNEGDDKVKDVATKPKDDQMKGAEEPAKTPIIAVAQSSLTDEDQMVIAELMTQPKEKEIACCPVLPVPKRKYLAMMKESLCP